MTHLLNVLKHEHRVIERACGPSTESARLEWGQHVPAEVLSQLVEFIETFADRYHHGKEE
jgi:hemerythrin-like domain-containing protein